MLAQRPHVSSLSDWCRESRKKSCLPDVPRHVRGARGPHPPGGDPTEAGRACGGQDFFMTTRHARAAAKMGSSMLLAISRQPFNGDALLKDPRGAEPHQTRHPRGPVAAPPELGEPSSERDDHGAVRRESREGAADWSRLDLRSRCTQTRPCRVTGVTDDVALGSGINQGCWDVGSADWAGTKPTD